MDFKKYKFPIVAILLLIYAIPGLFSLGPNIMISYSNGQSITKTLPITMMDILRDANATIIPIILSVILLIRKHKAACVITIVWCLSQAYQWLATYQNSLAYSSYGVEVPVYYYFSLISANILLLILAVAALFRS
jgi:hypothetical protein